MKSYSISELAKHISAKVIGDDQFIIKKLAPISDAQSGDLTFLSDSAYRRYLSETKASVVILKEVDAKDCPCTALIVENPEYAFALIASLFQTQKKPTSGVHSTAIISKTAQINSSASVGAYCVVGDDVVIGKNTIIHSGTIIHDGVVIGSDCEIHSHVTLHHQITLGNHVVLHSGVVIGADGFGLAQHKGAWEKIPQLGSVIIGDHVEIGANSCVDRGALNNTVIENGVKIDNLVMVAHNVRIGAHTVIAGCSSVAGSTTIGDHCIIGGAVTIGGHITISRGAIFTGCAMVTNSVKEPGIYSSGTGLFPNKSWRKVVAQLRRLGKNKDE
jgi:UDP-3-O-[3-hydroxymyristoyl] glucosamine N-acyltransferase